MGLRRWFDGLFGDGGDGDGTAGGSGTDGLDLTVDVERRAGAIADHYDLPAADARRAADVLASELGREEGYARTMIADRLARELDVDEERARTIVDTEVASVRNLARARRFRRAADGAARVRWVDSVGTDDSPVCADVRARIDERGPVSVEELESLLREAAAANEGGTPGRAADLVPHESCRHTLVRHFEEG